MKTGNYNLISSYTESPSKMKNQHTLWNLNYHKELN